MKPSSLVIRYVLPALAGVAVGKLLVPENATSESKLSAAKAGERENLADSHAPLPDDSHAIELAALGGRTIETKRKVAELLAEGADNQEIVKWLTPVLISDPGWMENFIAMLPEGSRESLITDAMSELSDHHLDAPWEVLKHSPSVLAMTRAPAGTLGQFLSFGAYQSSQAATFLLDPANGYTSQEIRQGLRSALHNPTNARTMLEAWKNGRLPEGLEEDVLPIAWLDLKYHHPDQAEALMKNPSSEQEAWLATRQQHSADTARFNEQVKHPESTPLEDVLEEHLAPYIETMEESGQRVPLEQLGRLPEDLRQKALHSYLRFTYPYHSEGVMEDLRTLPSLGFSEAEQLRILERGIDGEWSDCGNFANAIELAGMIPDAAKREEKRRELLDDLAKYDPEAAREYAATLPAGDDRSRLEQQARENQR